MKFIFVDQAHMISNLRMFIDNRLFDDAVFSDGKFGWKRWMLMQRRAVKMIAHDHGVRDACPFFDMRPNPHNAMVHLFGFDDRLDQP